MPKRKPAPPTTDTYGSDGGGFIDDGDGDGHGNGRRTKKVKNGGGDTSVGKGKGVGKDKGGGGKGDDRGGKEGGKGKGMGKGKDDKGEVFWELTSKRRVGITEFKGMYMVNIREYYEKDGETLPGKKGISLPIEQFNALIKVLPDIETALADKGQSIQRPDYSGAGASSTALDDDEEDEEEDEDEEVEKKGKKNFEETSDDE